MLTITSVTMLASQYSPVILEELFQSAAETTRVTHKLTLLLLNHL